jgi:hypothetical protein
VQDPILEATAREWQQVVHAAYHSAVQPFFNGSTAAGTADDPRSSGSSSSSGGSSSGGSTSSRSGHESVSSAVDAIAGVGAGARSKPQQPCSLQEWLWAVATVESRAFGATRQDVTAAAAATAEASPSPSSSSSSIGQPGTPGDWAAADPTAQWAGLVPVLDLANHSPKPHYQHRLNPSAGAFCLCWDGSSSQQADAPAVASPAACSSSSGAGGAGDDSSQRSLQQVLITYGSKDNR